MNDASDSPRARAGGDTGDAAPSGRGIRAWFRRLFGHRNGSDALRDTLEELIEQEDAGTLPAAADEIVLLRNILNLHGLTVYDVMVPRADIVAVDIDTSIEAVVKLTREEAHSRLPVYRGSLDDVLGMVHVKDLLAFFDRATTMKLADIVRPVLFIAPSMPVLEALLQMRVSRRHLALVVDEFGGVDGLVTIEDLVEEIVGEIEDEYDEDATPTLRPLPNGALEADARVSIKEFEDYAGPVLTAEEREEDIDTLGGLVIYVAGHVPARGEVIRHESGVEFQVVDADPRRIRRLRVLNLPKKTGPA
jgi:CBS domain containing-hemolysin-like protein